MRAIKDKVVAIMGSPSYPLPLKALFEFDKPSRVITDGLGKAGDDVKSWANVNTIPVTIHSPHFTTTGDYSIERDAALRELVADAESIFIYADYVPTSYDNYYHPAAEPELTDTDLRVIELAKEYGKPIEVIKLEKIYYFSFMIKEVDNDISSEAFTIQIPSKDKTASTARAKAIALAQLRFMEYITKWSNKYTFYLKILENSRFGDRYVDIDTGDIEHWYSSQIKRYQ